MKQEGKRGALEEEHRRGAVPRPWPCTPAPHSVPRGAGAGARASRPLCFPVCSEPWAPPCPLCIDADTEHTHGHMEGWTRAASRHALGVHPGAGCRATASTDTRKKCPLRAPREKSLDVVGEGSATLSGGATHFWRGPSLGPPVGPSGLRPRPLKHETRQEGHREQDTDRSRGAMWLD